MSTQPEALRLADWLDELELRVPSNISNCVSAAAELRRLASFNNQLMDEVSEQCRINGMSAEREDALRAEVEGLRRANAELLDALTLISKTDKCGIEGNAHNECVEIANDAIAKTTKGQTP